ncbi:MAG: YbjN domain-containing protein [Cyanobacteria bacterium P01_G01_bin.49]
MTYSTSESTATDNLMTTHNTYQDAIETVIASLQQNDSAMVHHDQQEHLWKFQYGSVEIYVQLTGESDDDLLTVWSPVLKLPAKNETELMQKLLEMNWGETLETRFGIMKEQVVVLTQRTVADLSPGEISRAITLVATIADDNDEKLKEEFGGS